MVARDISYPCPSSECQDEHAALATLPSEHTRVLQQYIVFEIFYFIQTTSTSMNFIDQVIPNEVADNIPKGFLESSEEVVCMKPFKEHPKGLAAFEER